MKIKILPQFWIFALLFAALQGGTLASVLMWIAILPVSVLVHELGHAFVIRLYNLRASIELGMFGGSTRYYGGNLGLLAQFLVTLMGPLFGIGFALFAFYLRSIISPEFIATRDALELLSVVNIFWSIINLVPVLPLDGGKIMAIMCETLFPKYSVHITYFLSGLFAVTTAFIFLMIGQMMAGAFFLLFAFDSFRVWNQARRTVLRKEENPHLIEEIEKAAEDWMGARPEEAIKRLEKLYHEASDAVMKQEALERLGQYLLLSKQPERATSLLSEHETQLSPDGLKILQLAAYQSGEYKKALSAGQEAFRQHQTTDAALLNAFAAARLGMAPLVVNWLQSAHALGGVDMKKVMEAEELSSVRSDPLVQQFMNSL